MNKSVLTAARDIKRARSRGKADTLHFFEEEYRLYYVACSRARMELINAEHL